MIKTLKALYRRYYIHFLRTIYSSNKYQYETNSLSIIQDLEWCLDTKKMAIQESSTFQEEFDQLIKYSTKEELKEVYANTLAYYNGILGTIENQLDDTLGKAIDNCRQEYRYETIESYNANIDACEALRAIQQ